MMQLVLFLVAWNPLNSTVALFFGRGSSSRTTSRNPENPHILEILVRQTAFQCCETLPKLVIFRCRYRCKLDVCPNKTLWSSFLLVLLTCMWRLLGCLVYLQLTRYVGRPVFWLPKVSRASVPYHVRVPEPWVVRYNTSLKFVENCSCYRKKPLEFTCQKYGGSSVVVVPYPIGFRTAYVFWSCLPISPFLPLFICDVVVC